MEDKEKFIRLFSDPEKVQQKANKFGLDIKLSTRKNKKYMFLHPETKRWIHFGDLNYEDYTKHMNENRRRLFSIRNRDWENAERYSPRWASWNLTW